jgi:hypothetical protein
MTAFSTFCILFWRISLVIFLAGSLALYPHPAFSADGVVGTGSAASCTEMAFNTVAELWPHEYQQQPALQ